jgi:DNA-directed RNA polymerase subunit RPC12/RpoP
MNASQRFLKAILPASAFAALEAESRTWLLRCPHCGHEYSLWDIGGIRYKAAGNPRRYAACPQCGQRSWQSLYKRSW